MRKLFYFSALVLLLASCSSDPVKVVIGKTYDVDSIATNHWIVIDGKDSTMLDTIAKNIMLKPGEHSFVLENGKSQKFNVGEKGGLLNPTYDEYIGYEIEYADKNKTSLGFNMNSMRYKSILLLDSFVIIPSKNAGSGADSSLRSVLPQLMAAKNGNFFLGTSDYDTNEQIQGLKKFGKDKLFIDKFWDYDLGEDPPAQIQVQKSKYDFGNSSTTKTSVLSSKFFLLIAMISSDEFTVKSLKSIREGKDDEIKDKEKTDAQMKF